MDWFSWSESRGVDVPLGSEALAKANLSIQNL
jgi:hypothetical protein